MVIAILKVIVIMMTVLFLFLWRQQTNVAYPIDGGSFFGRQIKMMTIMIKTIRITDPTDIPMIAGVDRTVGKEEMIYFILDSTTAYMYWYLYFYLLR